LGQRLVAEAKPVESRACATGCAALALTYVDLVKRGSARRRWRCLAMSEMGFRATGRTSMPPQSSRRAANSEWMTVLCAGTVSIHCQQ
jgi:hypothetical protein